MPTSCLKSCRFRLFRSSCFRLLRLDFSVSENWWFMQVFLSDTCVLMNLSLMVANKSIRFSLMQHRIAILMQKVNFFLQLVMSENIEIYQLPYDLYLITITFRNFHKRFESLSQVDSLNRESSSRSYWYWLFCFWRLFTREPTHVRMTIEIPTEAPVSIAMQNTTIRWVRRKRSSFCKGCILSIVYILPDTTGQIRKPNGKHLISSHWFY